MAIVASNANVLGTLAISSPAQASGFPHYIENTLDTLLIRAKVNKLLRARPLAQKYRSPHSTLVVQSDDMKLSRGCDTNAT